MTKAKSATLGKRRFRIVRETIDGLCEGPDHKVPTISIGAHLRGRRLLEITIHEAIHAIHWEAPEHVVESTARDLARLLWREGYRLPKGTP